MSLEVNSNTVYYDTAKSVVKPKSEATASQEINAANITITEVPTSSRVSAVGQAGKNQPNGQGKEATDAQIKDKISMANNQLKAHRTRCEFSYHEETKRVSIKVIDRDTQETIREIPPEDTLEMLEKMWELAGLLVDEKR